MPCITHAITSPAAAWTDADKIDNFFSILFIPKFDPDIWILQLKGRPSTPNNFFQIVILQVFFFSWPAWTNYNLNLLFLADRRCTVWPFATVAHLLQASTFCAFRYSLPKHQQFLKYPDQTLWHQQLIYAKTWNQLFFSPTCAVLISASILWNIYMHRSIAANRCSAIGWFAIWVTVPLNRRTQWSDW